jgi:ubiquitin-conjugating enzyme E2 O
MPDKHIATFNTVRACTENASGCVTLMQAQSLRHFFAMDDDEPADTETNSTDSDALAGPRPALERFLARLFADRFLSATPATPTPTPAPAPHAAHVRTSAQIPFFAADTFSTDAPMGSQTEHVVFCVEDTVGLKDDKFSVGVVDRSFGDIDSHQPRPQRDYPEDIDRHEDIPIEDFQNFMRTGIPRRGTVLVSWQTQIKTELITETRLQLLDRALYVGDVVKRNAKDPVSGTVIGTKAQCTLFPATMFNSGQLTPAMNEDLSIRNVPAEEVINVHEYVEGALVIYGSWFGRIEDVFDEVALKLSNNSVVIVEDPDDLDNDDPMLDRLSVGDTVKTKKGNLRRGRWKYGAFDPNVRPEGMVVETRPLYLDVFWLGRRIELNFSGHSEEPPARLYQDEMDSEDFYVYDASRSAAVTLPLSADGADRSYHVTEVTVGDRVRFKDIAGAAVKYDGSKGLPNGYPQGKLTKIPRTETLGYDLNVFLVLQTHTQVTVLWQDLSITNDPSTSLIPDPNVEDDDEMWPGEIVCSKEQREGTINEMSWAFKPARVGIVQGVKSRDRIATVQWFENPTLQLLHDNLMPFSKTGELGQATEDVSLYDVRSTPGLTRRRGDFVLISPLAFDERILPDYIKGPIWFGEVIDLGLDGKVTVRLGAAKPVVDIRVAYEGLTLAYTGNVDDQFLSGGESGSEDDDEEDVSDFDSASFNEMWIEYETMDGEEPSAAGNDEDWSTESENESSDDDMPDLEPVEDVATSNTTLETRPDGKQTFPLADETEDSRYVQRETNHRSRMAVDRVPTASEETQNAPSDVPSSFAILDSTPPNDHHFISHTAASSSAFMRRIAKEHKILRNSLPPGIFVRTWESRLDLIRVLMIGPSETPYENAPFIIDFHLSSSYPQQPPWAFFHSWTYGNGPVNPNLYEDGKICLSLLGTWHTDERNEGWSPTKSTLLQLLVSIMGLVLVKEPYYNEAGYDVHRATPETKLSSALYTERSYFRSRAFIVHALTEDVAPFTEELMYLYRSSADGAPNLLGKAIEAAREVLERSSDQEDGSERDGLRKISLGAVVMLKREVEKLERIRDQV